MNISEIENRRELAEHGFLTAAGQQMLIQQDIPALIAHVRELETQLETERMRLGVCGVAALGYFTDCKEEYRSASLEDVLRLYAKAGELERQVKEMEVEIDSFRRCAALNKEQPNE